MDLNELHRQAVNQWCARVVAVGDADWRRPTPCADWDVRALVNHVVGEDLWTRPIVEGRRIEEVGDRYDGDVLGDSPARSAASAGDDAVSAVRERLPDQPVVHLSFGDFPIEEYVWQVTTDHLIHGWDLAAATAQARDLDAALVEEVAGWFAEREELYRAAGAIGPRVDTSGAADAQAQLLAAFGRHSAW